MPEYKLTYFDGKWLGEPIRYILKHSNVEFEDIRIKHEDWPKIKNDYPYGVIPMLEIDGVKFSQSFSIARFLGKKFGLSGANDIEDFKCDEYADAMKDLLKEVEAIYYATEDRKAEIRKTILEKSVPKFIGKFNSDLKASGSEFFVGNKLTWVDILIAHWMENFQLFMSEFTLDEYPFMKKHQERIFKLPKIAEWRKIRPVTEF